jgi:hypothetical protein
MGQHTVLQDCPVNAVTEGLVLQKRASAQILDNLPHTLRLCDVAGLCVHREEL